MRNQSARARIVVIAVTPLVHAHLGALHRHLVRQALCHVLAMAVLVNGDRGLVAVCDRPDDVFRTKRRIATEKHACAGGLEGDRVDDRYIPLVELDADIPFHEGKGILLADREDYIVAGQDDPVEFGRLQPAVLIFVPLDYRKLHTGQLAVFDNHP